LQVIKNLVSNAVKYSPEGGEIVCAARQEGGMLLISVRDQGMGIALAERERIFEQFYRIDDSEKRIPGGIGLGLALVREVVRAHGGRVWLESEVGAGSTFYFSLPIAADEQVDSEPT
jgi:signal transduction histidine kinase